MLKDLLKKGFTVKLDLKDAYFTLPLWKGASKVLKVPLEGNTVTICLSAIRAGQCPQNIPHSHENCSGNFLEFRDSTSNIPKHSV